MKVYFDNAATSFPKPPEVSAAVCNALTQLSANPGRAGHKMAIEANRTIYKARCALARYFNLPATDAVVFTCNATLALNMAIKGVLLPGDHVVTTTMEHNSVLRPLQKLADNGTIALSIVAADATGLVAAKQVSAAIRPQTRLVVVNHASNVVGTINPIREIGHSCRQQEVLFLVDASQTAGYVPIDVEADCIDMLAAPGHKGLYGPQGTGFLYLRPGIKINTLIEGGTGGNSESLLQPELLPDRLESGTLNAPGIAGLAAAIAHLEQIGQQQIWQQKQELFGYLLSEIRLLDEVLLYGPLDPKTTVPVLSFNVHEADGATIAMALDDCYNIMLRVGLHCAPLAHQSIGTFPHGTIRISLGIYNTRTEIDYFIGSLKQVIREL